MSKRTKNLFRSFWCESSAYFQTNTPEQRLIVAFIGRAMMDFMDPPDVLIFRSAKVFINSEETETPFCLYWCLAHISDDPDHMQKTIRDFCKANRGKRIFSKMHWVGAGYKEKDNTIH